MTKIGRARPRDESANDARVDGGELAMGKGRFEAFSDGVFAIAITLLVLAFQPPDLRPATDERITAALLALWPQYLVYAASFAIIGIMWINHNALFARRKEISHGIVVMNLALLMFISFLPFPTAVLGRLGVTRIPVIYYGLTLLAIALCFNALQYLVCLKDGERAGIFDFVRRRNVWNTIGVAAYVTGIALAFVSPLATIVLYAAIALYYLLPLGVRAANAA